MRDDVFDALVRSAAQKEDMDMSLSMKRLLEKTLQNPEFKKRARRLTQRTMALALLIALAVCACAYALVTSPTVRDILADFFGEGNDTVKRIDQVTAQPQGQVYEMPDFTVTVTDAVYDGHSLWLTGTVAPKDGCNVVIMSNNYGPGDPFGVDIGYGATVPAGTPANAEKAAQTGARLIKTHVNLNGSGMRDSVLNADGTYSFINSNEDLVPQDGMVSDTLTLIQYEITAEDYELENSRTQKEFPLRFPILNAVVVTPVPTATPIPESLRGGAITVIGGQDGSDADLAFKEANPGAVVVYEDPVFSNEGIAGTFATAQYILEGKLDWDVALLFSQEHPLLEELTASGKLAVLTHEPEVQQLVARMYPKAADLLCVNGQVVALPESFSLSDSLMALPQAAAALGLDSTCLATYGDLLDLAEAYISLPAKQREGYVIFQRSDLRLPILDDLMTLREAACDASGEPVTYNAPETVRLLRRAEEVSKRLVKEEKRFTEERDGRGGGQLLLDYQRDWLLLAADTEPLYPACGDFIIVNANSKHPEQALRYALTLSATEHASLSAGWYSDLPPDGFFVPSDYATRVAPYITFPHPQPYENNPALWEQVDSLKSRYVTNKISVEELLGGLDALLSHPDR